MQDGKVRSDPPTRFEVDPLEFFYISRGVFVMDFVDQNEQGLRRIKKTFFRKTQYLCCQNARTVPVTLQKKIKILQFFVTKSALNVHFLSVFYDLPKIFFQSKTMTEVRKLLHFPNSFKNFKLRVRRRFLIHDFFKILNIST